MARCGCGATCSCVVQAGDNVTVTGNGSVANPYIVSATTGEVGAVAVDTPCINMTLTGTGTLADPFLISAAPIIAAEPNGLSCGAGGLAVAPSTDAGNALTIGTDGNLLVPAAAAGVTALDNGCGIAAITGAGTLANPFVIAANTDAWPFTCAQDANAPGIYCSPTTGKLQGAPEHGQREFGFYGGTDAVNGNIAPGATYTFTTPIANIDTSSCYPDDFTAFVVRDIQVELDLSAFGPGVPKSFVVTQDQSIDGGVFSSAQVYNYNDVPPNPNWADRRALSTRIINLTANAPHTIQYRITIRNDSPNTIVHRTAGVGAAGMMVQRV